MRRKGVKRDSLRDTALLARLAVEAMVNQLEQEHPTRMPTRAERNTAKHTFKQLGWIAVHELELQKLGELGNSTTSRQAARRLKVIRLLISELTKVGGCLVLRPDGTYARVVLNTPRIAELERLQGRLELGMIG